jgi:hypothetical protein
LVLIKTYIPPLPVSTSSGIAWDAKRRRLFVTGKYWPKVYEVSLKAIHLPGDIEITKEEVERACIMRRHRR